MIDAEVFALCDDSGASDSLPRSRLYTGYLGQVPCSTAEDLPAALAAMQEALAQGKQAVSLLGYELGAQLQGVACRKPDAFRSTILLFADCTFLSSEQANAWLARHEDAARPAGVAGLSDSVGEEEFHAALAQVHRYIEAGDTYQINYTYRLDFDAYGGIHALYRRLRQRQPVPYGALIALPDGGAVLSLSPELFIRHEAGKLTARPMKGTAPATGDAVDDARRAQALADDPKNRAENLMIVDLLRNDLGRVARTGTVAVPRLFEVTRFAGVLQMTSTVEAVLQPEAGLHEVLTALYPCGSITGAPKRRSMEIIAELESTPRGLYTGAIGWFEQAQEGSRIGDFCLSVPIRTMLLQPEREGLRRGRMGVGAGIVYDSDSSEEFEECRLKARFLTGLAQPFSLFETMHAERGAGCRHVERHLQRLLASAAYFGFAQTEKEIRAALDAACAALADGPHRMRLALHPDARIEVTHAQLVPLAATVRLLLSERAPEVDPLFLRHKTTMRSDYDAGWRAAEAQGAFDTLFCNARGELTEGGRSNLFVKLGGRWITPPLSCGVLPGIMRAVLLDDPAWGAEEGLLKPQDLQRAEAIVACNSLRGALSAALG
jgi:para-aminobenzoate synthetase/4-amino-4-deoxychorismate lyase